MSTLAVEETQIPLAADDFNALEQRVLRMVELVKSEREARAAAEERAQSLESKVKRLEENLEQTNQKLAHLSAQSTEAASHAASLEKERDTVRVRIEKLLKHLEQIPA